MNGDVTKDWFYWNDLKEKKLSIDQLHNYIFEQKDPALAYFCAKDFHINVHKMQQIIIDSKNPKYATLFAQYIPNSDIKALQKIVEDSKRIKYIYDFCDIENCDLNNLSNFIIKSNNTKYCFLFMKKFGINNKMKNIIINSKSPIYLYELARLSNDKKLILKLENILIKTGKSLYLRLFAQHIKHANILKLEKELLKLGDMQQIKMFAAKVKKSSIKNFLISA